MNAEEILARLVAFPSVVGRPNAGIVDWIARHLTEAGARVTVLPGPEGDRANLFATLGPAEIPGLILSGHMDVVPAGEPEWTSDPFALRAEGERLYGRGSSDMKGFLAAALAAVPALTARPLAKPVHFAFSYDEEAGCRGAPHLIERLPELCARPEGCIIGEPSGLRAIRAHKGKAAARIEITGRTGHSSRPDQGLNAIHAMAEVLGEAVRAAEALTQGPFDARFEPPYSSLQVGVIAGGQAVNVIPDRCRIEVEARAIAGIAPRDLLNPIEAAAERLRCRHFGAEFTVTSAYPALALDVQAPLAKLMRELTGIEPLAAVSYGSEAGLYQAAGIDAIVCGPGDIARAHKPNEYIERSELAACQELILNIAKKLTK